MAKKIFGTREWAKHSLNITNGCSNDCKYCYARYNYIKSGNTNDWKNETKKENLPNIGKKDGTIMFPTTHDITENNIEYVIPFVVNLLKKGNNLLIVSKPRLICIDKLTTAIEKYKENVLFRFTIGAKNNEILSFWETNASKYEERLECLKLAYNRGFYTSVSSEPLLDLDNVNLMISELNPFITDSIWIGKMNKADTRLGYEHFSKEEMIFVNNYLDKFNNSFVFSLYEKYKDNNKIKWKESIKEIVGLDLAEESGLDI